MPRTSKDARLPASGKKMAGRDFLSVDDLSAKEIQAVFGLAADVKKHPSRYRRGLKGKILALLFEKPSLRTRTTFTVGVSQLGGDSLTLTQAEIQSLLTFRMQGLLPPGIHGTEIEIGDSTLVLSARVDPRELRGMASPELLERFLSDSARVAAELAPEVLQPGVASLRVVALQAGSLVIPSMMVPWILGGVEIPGAEVTGSAVLLPVPGTVRQFAVINGRLHLKTVDD